MLSVSSDAEAELLLVEPFAPSVHGLPRATGDIDLRVRPPRENADRVMRALREFGAPPDRSSHDDLVRSDTIVRIRVPPPRIVNNAASGRPRDLADVARLARPPSNADE